MAQKITHWLLITLILSLGFGQLLRFDFLGLPLYLHDVLVICLLLLRGLALKNIGLSLFFVGLALGWISALLHYPLTQLLIPLLYTFRLLAYLALYLSLQSQKIKIPRLAFLVSGTVTLCLGVTQYFLLPDMRIFHYLGWDDHLNRLILPHFDPTFTAVMLSLFLLFLANFKSLLIIPAILLTYSRSIWVSLILTMLIFMKPKKILLLLIPIFLVGVYILPHPFGEGTNLLRTYSISSRITSDLTVIKEVGWNLFIGQGMNTFPRNSINNSYLYLLATTGFLGLLGWGVFLLGLYKKSHHKPMIIFFCLASLFNNVMFYPFALLWILMIEAMVQSEA